MVRSLLPLLLFLVEFSQAASIKRDETVVFFPDIGRRVDGGDAWEIHIHGWVFELEGRGVVLAVFRKALGLNQDELTADERAIFAERARAFLVDNERRKRITVRLCEREYTLGPTKADGHVTSQLKISAQQVGDTPRTDGDNARIAFHTVADDPNVSIASGEVHLLEPTGVSVISDIDDTIKVSEVTDRKALLRNTFLKPFQAVDGMAPVYRSWASETKVQFHYVTASPWQLYPALSDFIRSNRFPAGTFHMKSFRWKDESFFNLFKSPQSYKLRVIKPIIKSFSGRRFVLVGDSGERDPEIYATLARKYPEQVVTVLIRDVTGEEANGERYRKVFKNLPAARWRVFRQPGEIKDALRELNAD